MHWDENVRLELLDLRNHLLEIILRRRPEMKAAHDGVHLLNTGDLLRLPHRIDDATWPQELITTRPLPRMLKQVACSCTCWSG